MPIALDDVCFNKAAIIERCLERACSIVEKDWNVFINFARELGLRVELKRL